MNFIIYSYLIYTLAHRHTNANCKGCEVIILNKIIFLFTLILHIAISLLQIVKVKKCIKLISVCASKHHTKS